MSLKTLVMPKFPPAAADLVAFGFSEEDLAVLALAIRPALPPVFKVE